VSSAQRRKALQERIARGEYTPRRLRSHFTAVEVKRKNDYDIASMRTQTRERADKCHNPSWAHKTGSPSSKGRQMPGLVKCRGPRG
jgi:anthranilate phosphoribosyltransferase